jgi:cell division protein ZapA
MGYIDVTIMDREYRLACSEEEKPTLTAACVLVDEKMRELKDSGKVAGVDKIAVMSALTLAHELVSGVPSSAALFSVDIQDVKRKIDTINRSLDSALGKSSDQPMRRM